MPSINTHNLSSTHMWLGKAFLMIENSNFLNPTSVVQRKLEGQYGSIREAIEANIANLDTLFNPEKKTSLLHRVHVPIATLSRFVVTFTCYVVIPPVGALANATLCLFTLTKYGMRKIHLLNADQSLKNADWQKVNNYANGAFQEVLWTVWIAMNSLTLIYGMGGAKFYGFMGVFLPPIIMQFSPDQAIQFMASKELRAGLMKAVYLRKMFGIVDQSGGILEANEMQDDELKEGRGYFFSLYIQTCTDLSLKLKEHGCTAKFEQHATSAEAFVRDVKSQNLSEAQMTELSNLAKRLMFLKKFLTDMIEARENEFEIFGDSKKKKYYHHLPLPENLIKDHYEEAAAPASKQSWDTVRKSYVERKQIKNDTNTPNFESAENKAKYLEFKKRVFKNCSAEEFLGYDGRVKSRADTNKSYRKWVMLIHPDKVKQLASTTPQIISESEELFKILSDAYKECLDKFPG